MAITSHVYTLAIQGQWNGSAVNWTSDTIKCALVTASYTPAQDTDQFWSTPQANEIVGTGYSAGGNTLASCTVGSVIATHEIPLKAANTSWSTASFTCRYAVVYKSTGTAATSPLVAYVDFGGNETVASGTFAINFDSTNGVVSISAA